MTDTKRILEQEALIRSIADTATGQERDDWNEVAGYLSDLARIKGAALSVPEIEQAHLARATCIESRRELAGNGVSQSERIWALNEIANLNTPEHRDRATLLDALRAKEAELAEISAAWEAEHSTGGTELKPALTCMLLALKHLRDHKREMENGFNMLIGQRDEARAQLAKAQKEIEEINQDREQLRRSMAFKIATLHKIQLAVRFGSDGVSVPSLTDCVTRRMDELATAQEKLAQAERDRAAMQRLLKRCSKCKSECGPCRCECHGYMEQAAPSVGAGVLDVEAEKGQESKAESERDSYRYFTEAEVRKLILEPGERAPAGSLVVVDDDGGVLPAEQYNATLAAHRDVKTGNVTCGFCKGKGWAWAVDAVYPDRPPLNPRKAPCLVCNGSGDENNPKPEKPEGA